MKSQPPSRTYHSRDREKRVGGSTKWLLEFLLGAGMCQLPSILLAKRDDKAKLDSGQGEHTLPTGRPGTSPGSGRGHRPLLQRSRKQIIGNGKVTCRKKLLPGPLPSIHSPVQSLVQLFPVIF